MNMFRDSIQGLEKIFGTDIQPPKVVMVTGPPGSMKTSFCYSIISSYLEGKDERGLYVTLEESAKSQLSTLNSVDVKPLLTFRSPNCLISGSSTRSSSLMSR